MAHPYDHATGSYEPKAKTGQRLAESRYGDLPKGDGDDGGRRETAPEEWNGAPARQVSNTGKVRK